MSSHMNGRTFQNNVLVENWFEDRFDTAKVGVDQRLLRTGRIGETPIKWDRAIPDMYTSVSHSSFDSKAALRPNTEVQMINKHTAKYVSNNKSAPPKTGYPGELSQLEDTYTSRSFVTTHNLAFGGPYATNPSTKGSGLLKPYFEEKTQVERRKPVVPLAEAGVAAGLDPNIPREKGVRSFGSTGERVRLEPTDDPKEHTLMQRSWIYNREASKFYKDRNPDNKHIYELPPELATGYNIGGNGSRPSNKERFPRMNDTIKAGTGVWSDC